MKTLNIQFGTLAGTIAQQLKTQKFHYNAKFVKVYQESAHAINLLWFHDVIATSQKNKAFDKLFKQIKLHVENHNKQTL